MKKYEIANAIEALKTVKLNKIEDKELRATLIADFTTLVREKREFDTELSDLREVYLGSYQEELRKVQGLQEELRIEKDGDKQLELAREINSHKELFDAIQSYNAEAEEIGKKEVPLRGIELTKFVKELESQECDLAVLEAVFPMLK